MEHEIVRPVPLLDEKGDIVEPGWARKLYPVYDRAQVRHGGGRFREWDRYLIFSPEAILTVSLEDRPGGGLDTVVLLDLQTGAQAGRQFTRKLLPAGLGGNAARGNASASGKGYGILFHSDGRNRTVTVKIGDFLDGLPLDVHMVLTDLPAESLVLSVPLAGQGRFRLSQRLLGMRAEGRILLGDRQYAFSRDSAAGILDWTRGVWPKKSHWYWGAASGFVDGLPFGLNIGSSALAEGAPTENAVLCEGRIHKLSKVAARIPRDGKVWALDQPWTFHEETGRLEVAFHPEGEWTERLGGLLSRGERRQVFGSFSGSAVLDDGQHVDFTGLEGFVERVQDP